MTTRGNRRESLFYDAQDRQGFLGRVRHCRNNLASFEVHAFVRMDNHDPLLRRTPEPNPSQAIQWRGQESEGKVASVCRLVEVVRRMAGLK